jgi:hypothetical protein
MHKHVFSHPLLSNKQFYIGPCRKVKRKCPIIIIFLDFLHIHIENPTEVLKNGILPKTRQTEITISTLKIKPATNTYPPAELTGKFRLVIFFTDGEKSLDFASASVVKYTNCNT